MHEEFEERRILWKTGILEIHDGLDWAGLLRHQAILSLNTFANTKTLSTALFSVSQIIEREQKFCWATNWKWVDIHLEARAPPKCEYWKQGVQSARSVLSTHKAFGIPTFRKFRQADGKYIFKATFYNLETAGDQEAIYCWEVSVYQLPKRHQNWT
jgi:hypothetical protein